MKTSKMYLYILEAEIPCLHCDTVGYVYKIGLSDNPDMHVQLLGGPESPMTVSLVCNRVFGADRCAGIAWELRARYNEKRYRGAWYLLSDIELGDCVGYIMDYGARERPKQDKEHYIQDISKLAYEMKPRVSRRIEA